MFDVLGISNVGSTIWVDGIPYDMTVSGTQATATIPSSGATFATLYTYATSSDIDPTGVEIHSVYPNHMYVWTLNSTGFGSYHVQRNAELDDVLKYAGCAIRITGNKGIRMVTAVPDEKREKLLGEGLGGFTLEEYGTTVSWASAIQGTDVVLDNASIGSNYAYKKNVSDPIYKREGGFTKYTNVLVGFNNNQCSADLAMRPYAKLRNTSTGDTVVLYGGTVIRSIGYIAYQCRNDFDIDSDGYNFLWDIIHVVYGTELDDLQRV